jgi:erythromycin esterase
MLIRLSLMLVLLSSFALADPCTALSDTQVSGTLQPGEKACFKLNLMQDELSSWKVEGDNSEVSLTVQNPQGDEISQAQTGGHQKLWKSQRFIAKTPGNYTLTVEALNQTALNFQLTQQERLSPAQYASELGEFDHWLKNNAIALDNKASFEQLNPMLAKARLIGIGEASHGNRDFWDIRTDLVLHLAKQQQMRVIALEISPYIGRRMDSFVRNLDQTSQQQIVNEIGNPMFSTAGMWAFLQALRNFNQTQEKNAQISIVGVDIHPGRNEDRFLRDYLTKVAPNLANSVDELMSDRVSKAIWQASQFDTQRRASWITAGVALQQQFLAHQTEWIAASSSSEYALAAIALNARIGAASTMHLPWQQSMPRRDQFMHRNMLTLLQAQSSAHPVVFLAHDMHISASPDFYSGRRVGSLLRESLGSQYLAIGTAFDQGSVLALKMGSTGTGVFTMGPSMPQSLGHYLSRSDSAYYALLMPAASDTAASLLNSPLKMRTIPLDSGEHIAELQYETIIPARDFDVLIFKKQVSADLSLARRAI